MSGLKIVSTEVLILALTLVSNCASAVKRLLLTEIVLAQARRNLVHHRRRFQCIHG